MTKVYEDFKGAPFKIGDAVEVIWNPDEVNSDISYLGCTGVVSNFDYVDSIARVYPEDPLTGVKFPDGRIEYFRTEYLRKVYKPAPEVLSAASGKESKAKRRRSSSTRLGDI